MSIKVCTSEQLLSTGDGVGLRRNWFPRVVEEVFLESKKDGEIKRAPDPVTMIDGALTWYNNTGDDQHVTVQIIRAPRTVVAQSPSTVLIHDATSHAVGKSPTADYPSVVQDAFGGRMQIDRESVAADQLQYGRFFADGDASQSWVTIGVVPREQSLHFRYIAAVQTPGTWTTPSEFEPRWEANARYARLLAFAAPVGESS